MNDSERAQALLEELRRGGALVRLQAPRPSANPADPPPENCPKCRNTTRWLALSQSGRWLCARCYTGWGAPPPACHLHVQAPSGLMTPDLAARIRELKPSLVEILRMETCDGRAI